MKFDQKSFQTTTQTPNKKHKITNPFPASTQENWLKAPDIPVIDTHTQKFIIFIPPLLSETDDMMIRS